MSESRATSTLASIVLLVLGLGVQVFGHVGDAGEAHGVAPPTHSADRHGGQLTSSDDCPACILMLQARSLGPPAVAADEPLVAEQPVAEVHVPGFASTRTRSTVARAPPHAS
jgi:hypothetical protein